MVSELIVYLFTKGVHFYKYNAVQQTAESGDIMLYSGNQLVVFYGNNSWAYTKLGKIQGMTEAEITELLSNGDVTITISK